MADLVLRKPQINNILSKIIKSMRRLIFSCFLSLLTTIHVVVRIYIMHKVYLEVINLVYSEKTTSTENIFKGKVVSLNVHTVELPNKKIAKREVINHPGGVAVLAFKDKDTILIVEQFRKPIEMSTLELPAGKLEYGENPEVCGIRELEEETGYKAKNFSYIGKIVTSPGFCDEYIYLYKAEDLFKGTMNLDEDEFLNVKEIALEEIKQMILNGKIIDAKTICAIGMISIK